MAQVYRSRGPFVAAFLAAHPYCMAGLARCQGRSVDVHEAIPRSQGGVILPGPEAEAQGQEFFALCRACHDWIGTHPGWAKAHGYRKDNPARRFGE